VGNSIIGVHHVSYLVPNVDAIQTYFEKYFDMKPAGFKDLPDFGFKSVLYKVGDVQVEFNQPYLDENGEAVVQRDPAVMFARKLKEGGPQLFHVGWKVEGIEDIFEHLREEGMEFEMQAHYKAPVTKSLIGGYSVLNVHPKHIGPDFAKAVHGQFFQLAEGPHGWE